MRLTDNDIVKALEHCKNNGDCKDCVLNPHVGNYGYCTSIAIEAALDLINRQKAEIEMWKDIAKRETGYVGIARAEAIKEFAERLKKRVRKYTEYDDGGWDMTVYSVEVGEIDNLVKEMTEETP